MALTERIAVHLVYEQYTERKGITVSWQGRQVTGIEPAGGNGALFRLWFSRRDSVVVAYSQKLTVNYN